MVAACVLGIGVCAGFGPGLATVSAAEEAPTAEGKAFFETKIRPVLVKQCYTCHSAESTSVKGGLTLDTRAGIRKGGETGPAVVPGDVAKSLLISAIQHRDFEMPPKGKLEAGVVADFVKWVEMGAPDPRDGAVATGPRKIDIEEGRQFWCFRPVTDSAPPVVKNAAWSSSSIDRFLLARLEQAGLRPSPDADRATLIRRLTYDLTGLPPTPAEIDAFVADKSPGAYEKLVDRLLAAPQFGETWGRHWLDVARYGESNGNARNGTFPHAWRYRDWVIDAVNADVPYDRFVRMQVAGDLLPAASPAERNANLTATGFLALTSKVNAKGDEFRMEFVADQIEVTTRAFLGLSVACARCHDHKFDPIPTTDYYAMAGIFLSTSPLYGGGASVGMGAAPPTDLHKLQAVDVDPQELARIQQGLAELQAQRTAAAAQLKSLGTTVADAGTATDDPSRNARKAGNKKANRKKKNKQDDGDVDAKPDRGAQDAPRTANSGPDPRAAALESDMKRMDAQIAALRAKIPVAGEAMGVRDADKPVDTPVFLRGESRTGSAVPRNVVQVATVGPLPQIAPDRSGRLELAQWLTDPRQPLTARVMANRIWMHLFGAGLVATPDDFGENGERPTHPELLDHLATRFAGAHRLSVKSLIRELVLTRAYRMASDHDEKSFTADPDNKLHWRHSPRRLTAEEIRDTLLAASGQLVLERPRGSVVSEVGPALIQDKLRPERFHVPSVHRSVYLPIVRNGEPEVLKLFDMADPSLVVGRRNTTTVPAQELFLMNSPFAIEQSEAFAALLLDAKGPSGAPLDDAGRIDLAYRRALGRLPTDSERNRAKTWFTDTADGFAANSPDPQVRRARAWAGFCQALCLSGEFRHVK